MIINGVIEGKTAKILVDTGASKPGQSYNMDFITNLAPSCTNKYDKLLVIKDRHSQRVFGIPGAPTKLILKTVPIYFKIRYFKILTGAWGPHRPGYFIQRYVASCLLFARIPSLPTSLARSLVY
eukprot:SAG31_NODE_6241_length_2106_cov_10.479322_2_plen_124_part_00